MQKVQALYEGGVLRPVGPLSLEENQLVSLVVLDEIGNGDELQFEAPESFEALADHTLNREDVRQRLSKIPGPLDADFMAERNER